MDTNEFITKVSRPTTSQILMVTFTEDGLPSLRQIIEYSKSPFGKHVNGVDLITAETVVASDKWETDHNRSFRFSGLGTLDVNIMADIAKHIVSIEVENQHFASTLMCDVESEQKSWADHLVNQVLTLDLREKLYGMGILGKGRLIMNMDLPALEFRFATKDDFRDIMTFVIDGWSGRFGVVGKGLGELIMKDEGHAQSEMMQALLSATNRESAAHT